MTKTLSRVLVSALMSSCMIRRETRERMPYFEKEGKNEGNEEGMDNADGSQ